MGAVPGEFVLAAVAMAVIAGGVVLLVTGSVTAGWVVIGLGALLDTVAVAGIVRRAAGRGRPAPPAVPGMLERR
jgi:hypothetical protein